MRRVVDGMGWGCVLLSGAAALGHELLWTRRLVDLLGGSSEANTRVLSLFFFGLALGAMIAQAWLPHLRRPWRAAGLVEGCVALLALPALFLPQWREWLWSELAVGAGQGAGLKLSVSVLVVLPPSVAMGLTLPLFVTAMLGSERHLSRWGMGIYAINTLGGLLGLVAVALLLLPWLGATGSMATLCWINFAIGGVCLGLDRVGGGHAKVITEGLGTEVDLPVPPPDTGNASVAWHGPGGLWLWAAFFSGFGLLALEIVGLQLIMLVAPLSFHAPTAILAAVILMLVIGAALAPILNRAGIGDSLWEATTVWMVRSTVGSGVALLLTAPMYFAWVAWIPTDSAPNVTRFLAQLMFLTLLTFGPALLFAGLLFPLTFLGFSRQQVPAGGRRWAWLLAANGVGGLVGAEFAYRVLLPTMGVNASVAVIGLLYLGAGMVMVQMRQAWDGLDLGGWAVGLGVGLLFTWGWVAKLPEINPHLQFKILHRQAGPEGSIAVVERPDFGRAILLSNQYLLGSTGALADQRRQGHLPLLLHPAPRQVAFVGLATGITPSSALQHPDVEQVVAVEISQSVARLAGSYFSEENLGILDHPRARVVVEDGRTWIASQTDAYDVIVGDLYLPWAAGASRLYSVEHFQSCRRALRSGGLFCQWLPMHQLTETHLERIVASFQTAFPRVHLMVNSFSAGAPALGLVGWVDGDWEWSVIEARCREVRRSPEIAQPSLLYPEGIAMHYLGHLGPEPVTGPPITLDNLWLELDASRRQVTQRAAAEREPYLSQSAWRNWMSQRRVGTTPIERGPTFAERGPLVLELLQWEAQLREQDPNARWEARKFKDHFPEPWWLEIQAWERQWPGPNPILDDFR